MGTHALLRQLAGTVSGELRADPATRELYAADASLYRRLPSAVLRAGEAADLEAAVAACRDHGVPLTMRGGGTSLAGQTVGRGLVVDCSALDALEIDPDARRARVGPGVVLDRLNAAARAHGLAFGADVATSDRATLGGMIANNSAGARSVVHGLTADHVRALDVVMADGARAWLERGGTAPERLRAAVSLGPAMRAPSLLRRVSGYNLDALGGERPDWPRLLCGSEGTLAVTLQAELDLVPLPERRALMLLGHRSVERALAAVPQLLLAGPSAIELLDREMLDPANRPPAAAALTGFAAGEPALLIVEHSGSEDEVEAALARAPEGARLVRDPSVQATVWAARRAGIAWALRDASAMRRGGRDPRPAPFIEDPAVPPERVAAFATALRRLLDREGVPAIWYGHASVGCLHVRPMLDLRDPDEVRRMRRIAEATAELVAENGGSLSGEHGDGRARGELLPRMYPPETVAAFAALKRRLDPDGVLNPGVIVEPEPLDSGLRLAASPPRRARATALRWEREGGIDRAAQACNGNGLCRAGAGAMCPTFQALGDERHSTRGRAVLFRAAVEGRLEGGLADDGLDEALELCLGCKACKAECPAQVDMARMKIEALARRRRAGVRDPAALAAGHAHLLLTLGARAPRLSRLLALAGRPVLGRRLAAPVRPWRPPAPTGRGPEVALLADTFTRFLHPEVGEAAVRVLTAAGARVEVVDPGCCGRPLLSQGFVDAARRRARRTLERLTPHVLLDRPIVVLEPSCWSMLVDDLPDLVGADPRARWVADASVGFEQAVADLGGVPGEGGDGVVVHPHCHARALGQAPTAVAVAGPGAADSGAGCCGMAGAFGYRHGRLSRDIAELGVAPAARAAATMVAAGTSCRQQIRDTTGRVALHPAELLAARLAPVAR